MGYFDDDGNEIFPDLYPKPKLCLKCHWDSHPGEEILCNLNRIDQLNAIEFKCASFLPRKGENGLWKLN
jgi:hypothetical protein